MMINTEKEIGDNYQWFEDNYKELCRKYNRKWVVVYKKKVIYENSSSLKCYDYVLEHNLIGRSAIQFCGERQ